MGRFGGFKRMLVWIGFLAVALTGGVRNARADFTFGRPINLGPNINSSSVEVDPSISADGLELFFESRRPGGHGNGDIYVSRRASKNDPWGSCMNIGAPVNTAHWEQCPSVSADGLSLYFSGDWSQSDRSGGYGIDDLWVATRASVSDRWGPPVNLGATVNTSADEWMPSISADGLVLFFMSSRAGGFGGNDLWFTTRATKNDPWGSPVNLGATINSSFPEACPDISADGRMLFFSDHTLGPFRPGGYGGQDLWITARATTNDPWGKPMNLGPVINTSDWEFTPNISANGSTLYFCSGPPISGAGGDYDCDIWQAPLLTIVDFNGDEKVDIEDLLRLIESWGKADPSVDMAPMPWGDGVVDKADLEVLMSYWQQEILDPALAAYWKLDETEGNVAQNSVSDNHGTVYGQPQWQPTGGKKAGALQFDGINDYISTDLVLNPADGAFSVFAWIKGGAPGQVILAQVGAANWLMADSADGALRTDLKEPGTTGRDPKAAGPSLISPAVVTDGAWHRVGFVRDGISRILYMDDVQVARDTAVNLEAAGGDLYIGTGNRLEPGTFWYGLIDDIRIYSRAVHP